MATEVGGGGSNILALCYEAETEEAVLQVLAEKAGTEVRFVRPFSASGVSDISGGVSASACCLPSQVVDEDSLMLLREQAVRLRTADGRNALHCAVDRGWTRLVGALLDWGASPAEPGLGVSRNTPLHVAARLGNARVLKVKRISLPWAISL
jgi:hypothetical protein